MTTDEKPARPSGTAAPRSGKSAFGRLEKREGYLCPKCGNAEFFNNGWIGVDFADPAMPVLLPQPYGWAILICCRCDTSDHHDRFEKEYGICYLPMRPNMDCIAGKCYASYRDPESEGVECDEK